MDVENPHSPGKTNTFHAHRLDHNPSKLPTFRFVDLKKSLPGASSRPLIKTESALASPTLTTTPATTQGTSAAQHRPVKSLTITTTTSTTPLSPPSTQARGRSASSTNSITTSKDLTPLQRPQPQPPVNLARPPERRPRRPPASHSSNGIETFGGPPPALSTQHSFPPEPKRPMNDSTAEWAVAQQHQALESSPDLSPSTDSAKPTSKKPSPRVAPKSLDAYSPTTPRIPPIRAFRASRATFDMNNRAFPRFDSEDDESQDRDRTLRALEGYADQSNNGSSPERLLGPEDRKRPDASTEDLFLNLARDDLSREGDDDMVNGNRAERRRSRIAVASHHRSLPPVTTSYEQPQIQPMPRRGSDLTGSSISRRDFSLSNQRQSALPPFARDRNTVASSRPLSDLNKSRYASSASRSTPTTPRGTIPEHSLDSQLANAGRRPSVPESSLGIPGRGHTYRQSNLSYATSRTYNSSPLVQRTEEDIGPETPRALLEGTESTASTTAPSTVWDELDDLKSRIRKLELTGKLPPTSGAAVQHASSERPRTATTTNTTMSTSPKRGQNSTSSPIESNSAATPTGELHPLLHSALAKSKSLLRPEVYKALEATAQDALAIAGMTGSGVPSGHISSAQSVIGIGPSTTSDRQVRRKADSLCRSLTELCLALSDQASSQPQSQALVVRPTSRDKELQSTAETPRMPTSNVDALTRSKSSPRALSRLEARRTSLLQSSALPAPRIVQPDAATPPQTLAGRRTSLLMRSRRVGSEEPETPGEERLRAPSRAATEVGRMRTGPREYTSNQPLPDRSPSVISNLPIRRTLMSSQNSGGLSPSSTMPNLSSRRFLDRSTPDRDTSSVVGRLAEDRGQRQPLNQVFEGRTLGRAGSLDRRRATQQQQSSQSTDTSTTVQVGGYQ